MTPTNPDSGMTVIDASPGEQHDGSALARQEEEISVARNWGVIFDGYPEGIADSSSLAMRIRVAPGHGAAAEVRSSRVALAGRYTPTYFYAGDDSFEYEVLRAGAVVKWARVNARVTRDTWVDVGGQVMHAVEASSPPDTASPQRWGVSLSDVSSELIAANIVDGDAERG